MSSLGTQLTDLIITNDNEIIAIGGEYNAGNSLDFWAEKISAAGAKVWKYVADYQNSQNYFKKVYSDNSSNTYLIGVAANKGSLTKLGSTGNLIWENVSSDTGAYNDIYGNPEKSFNVFITGSATISGSSRPQIKAVNPEGQQQCNYEIAVTGQNNYGQYITGDSEYLYLAGYTTESSRNQFIKFNVVDYNGQEKYNSSIKVAKEILNGVVLADFVQNKDFINLSFKTSLKGPSYATNEANEVFFANSLQYSKIFESLSVSDFVNNKVAFYPNPVSNILNIQSTSGIVDLSLYNFAGQQIGSKVKVLNGKVDLSYLLPSTYIVKALLSDGQFQTFKIIKK